MAPVGAFFYLLQITAKTNKFIQVSKNVHGFNLKDARY